MEGAQLFLTEFLVDNINIPAIRAIHEGILPAKTCVSFQILDMPPLHIYQESSVEACACIDSESQIFKKGKSCFFALPDIILERPLCTFPVTVSVYKELPPEVLPDVMLIGTCQIQICDLINSLLSQQIFQIGDTCRTMKDTFQITTATGQCVGAITLFIRVSCFGKKIVTQFQMPRNKQTYLFKGIEDGPLFQCKRITSVTSIEEKKSTSLVKRIGDGSEEATKVVCPAVNIMLDEHRRKAQRVDIRKDKCAPCCRVIPDTTRDKETVRKCGCVVKKERVCGCNRPSIQ